MLKAQGLESLTLPSSLAYSHPWILDSTLSLISCLCFYYYPRVLVQFFVSAYKNPEVSVGVSWSLIHAYNTQPSHSQEHSGQTVASAFHHQNKHTWDPTA